MTGTKLTLNNLESATLSLHMVSMRNSVKKGFKKAYGKDYKQHLKMYDTVTERIGAPVNQDDEINAVIDYYFNDEEFNMIGSFVFFYCGELQKMLEQAKKEKQEKFDILTLEAIKEKIDQACERLENEVYKAQN